MDPTTHLPTEAFLNPATTATATMRAIVQDRYGSSDTWQLTTALPSSRSIAGITSMAGAYDTFSL